MLEELKNEVCEVNLMLVEEGLVTQTWGNASAIDRASGLVAIKPSGIPYDELAPEHVVLVNLEGAVVEGGLKPSVDTPAHLELYKAFPGARCFMHPEDARKRGLNQGAEIRLISRRGEMRTRVETRGRNRMPPGVVFETDATVRGIEALLPVDHDA